MNDILQNLDKLHTTEMGVQRIKRNLGLQDLDVVSWCKTAISNAEKSSLAIIERKGKNWYIDISDIRITVNAKSFTIITAHKQKT